MDSVSDTKKRRRVFAREEVCVGCRLCEIHCIKAHTKYKDDIIKAFKKVSPRPLPRVTVEENKPLSFAIQCRHCDEPECVKSCITGAMQKDSTTGIVTHDKSRCIGCWTCILACPFGVIKRDYEGGKVASKCDFCIESNSDPECVKNCPNEALYIGEIVGINSGKGATVKNELCNHR